MQPTSEPLEPSKPNRPLEPPTQAQEGLNGSAVLHDLLRALQDVRVGDFSVRLPVNAGGIEGKIADSFNEIVAANQTLARQLEGVGQVVGREGRTPSA